MALNSALLATEIQTLMIPALLITDPAKVAAFSTAIAQAVVSHIVTNGQVVTTPGAGVIPTGTLL